MTKKEIAILVGAIVVVAAGVLIGIFTKQTVPEVPGIGTPVIPSGEQPVMPPRERYFKTDVPANATPSQATVEAPAAPNSVQKLKVFDLKISPAGYEPVSFTARRGDLVQIRVAAVGGNYDLEFPYLHLYQSIKAGEIKPISFGVDFTGTVDFLCRDFCGAGREIKGTFIAIP